MTSRTDIHRPSVIEPANYEFVAYEYLGPFNFDIIYYREIIQVHKARTGGDYSHHEHGGNCHICGAWALYTALFHHKPSNTYVRTGLDCANKLDSSCDGAAFRKKITSALEAKAGKRKAAAVLEQSGLGRAWAIYEERVEDPATARKRDLVCDIVGKLVQYGAISEKQEAFLRKLVDQIDNPPPCEDHSASKFIGEPKQRLNLVATVLFKASYDSDFGKILITGLKDDTDNILIVKGTTPFAAQKGERVAFRATVKKHNVREGVNQTILSRAKLTRLVPDEPVAIAA